MQTLLARVKERGILIPVTGPKLQEWSIAWGTNTRTQINDTSETCTTYIQHNHEADMETNRFNCLPTTHIDEDYNYANHIQGISC